MIFGGKFKFPKENSNLALKNGWGLVIGVKLYEPEKF